MKSRLIACTVVGTLVLLPTVFGQRLSKRGVTGHSSIIRGEDFTFTLVDETFLDEPTYLPASGMPIVLDPSAAYDIARDEFLRLKEPEITYRLESIHLRRYFDTDWWYYQLTFNPTSSDWKQLEPYRSRIADGNWGHGCPQIEITVLLNGKTILPQPSAADYRRQSASQSDP